MIKTDDVYNDVARCIMVTQRRLSSTGVNVRRTTEISICSRPAWQCSQQWRLKEVTNLILAIQKLNAGKEGFCVIQITLHSDWTIQSLPDEKVPLWMQSFLYSCNFYFPLLDTQKVVSLVNCSLLWGGGGRCYHCERQIVTECGAVTRSHGQAADRGRDLHWRPLSFLQGYGRCLSIIPRSDDGS